MSAAPLPTRGRGARSNATGRFDAQQREAFDDGWDEDDDAPRQLTTTILPEKARTVIARNDSPDIGFNRSINPYRGCEHGCIYCYARPTHAYYGLSPGLDFESKLFFKPQAEVLLARELSKPGYAVEPIHIGGNTDVYQPQERLLGVTRRILQTLQAFNHPLSIITKSALIVRDADILGEMGKAGLVRASVSITTLDRRLARSMEPRAATPEKRFETVSRLTDAGAPTSVNFAPIIPGLNDHELEAVLERAKAAGAVGAHYTVLRLPLEIKDLFKQWLESDHPDRARRVMSLVRQMRGGKDYDAQWCQRMKGTGPVADLIRNRFVLARRKHGLDAPRTPLDCSQFRVPPQAGDQMTLAF